MKTILRILLALSLVFFCSSLALAGDNQSNQEGSITLTDPTGGGPGVKSIPVANGSFVAYSADWNAGGFAGNAGQIMACVAAHSKANPDDVLYFAVRGSEDPVDLDDNRVYQLPFFGTVPTMALVAAEVTTDFSGFWHIRGGS